MKNQQYSSETYWTAKDKHNNTPLYKAIFHRQLDCVPPEILNEQNIVSKSNNLLTWATCKGQLNLIPTAILTEKNILSKDEDGDTTLHSAAYAGCLHQIPTEILTEKNLLRENKWGNTPLHNAACYGHLVQVPHCILTEKNMLITDNNGDTSLHKAASNGHLNQVPVALLTQNTMLKENNDGITPLHYAAIYGQLYLLSQNILSTENLLVKSKSGATPFGNSFWNVKHKVLPLKTMVACATHPKMEDDIHKLLFRIIQYYYIDNPVYSWLALNKIEQQALASTFASNRDLPAFFPKEGVQHFINALSGSLENWSESDIEAWHKMLHYPWDEYEGIELEDDKFELRAY